jgi:hypothetical protein
LDTTLPTVPLNPQDLVARVLAALPGLRPLLMFLLLLTVATVIVFMYLGDEDPPAM